MLLPELICKANYFNYNCWFADNKTVYEQQGYKSAWQQTRLTRPRTSSSATLAATGYRAASLLAWHIQRKGNSQLRRYSYSLKDFPPMILSYYYVRDLGLLHLSFKSYNSKRASLNYLTTY